MKNAKRALILLVAMTMEFLAHAEQCAQPAKTAGPSDRLIATLIFVESSGRDNAIGDKDKREKAFGPLQVRAPVCKDVNKRYGTAFTPERCLNNRELSIRIFKLYVAMYGTAERLHREPTDVDYARIWNGGPNGWKSEATKRYIMNIEKAETYFRKKGITPLLAMK